LLVALFISACCPLFLLFFFNHPPTTEIYTLSLHDALPISIRADSGRTISFGGKMPWRSISRMFVPEMLMRKRLSCGQVCVVAGQIGRATSELQSRENLVCRLLLEKKKNDKHTTKCACSTSI